MVLPVKPPSPCGFAKCLEQVPNQTWEFYQGEKKSFLPNVLLCVKPRCGQTFNLPEVIHGLGSREQALSLGEHVCLPRESEAFHLAAGQRPLLWEHCRVLGKWGYLWEDQLWHSFHTPASPFLRRTQLSGQPRRSCTQQQLPKPMDVTSQWGRRVCACRLALAEVYPAPAASFVALGGDYAAAAPF